MKKIALIVACCGFLFACNQSSEDCDTKVEDEKATNMELMVNSSTGATIRKTKFIPREKTKYQSLDNGRMVELEVDKDYGYLVDMATRLPILYFINTGTNDTIFGPTGDVVNNRLIHDAQYLALDTNKYKVEDDEMKLKFGADGKIKVETDEAKYKNGDTKIKLDGDEMKIKTKDQKIKIEDGEMKVK